MSEELLKLLENLSTLEGVGDTMGFWGVIGAKLVSAMCRIGIYITFITTTGAILQKFATSLSFNLRDYWLVLGKSAMVAIFFCILYPQICETLAQLSTTLNENLAADSIKDFRVQFRKFLYTLQVPPATEDASWVKRAWRWIGNHLFNKMTFFSPGTTVLNLCLGIATQIVILFVFLFMSVGSYFLIFALCLGPIAMSLWILFPDIARGWANMLIAGLLFSLVTTLGFAIIANSGLFDMVSSAFLYAQQFQALAFLVLILVYLTLVPFIMAQIFSSSAFNFLGRVCGWLYSYTFILAPLVVLSETMNWVVGGSFKKGAGKGKQPAKSVK